MQPDRKVDAAFDPETIEVLKQALDASWTSLSPAHQSQWDQSLLASRIFRAAASGERDPERLKAHALLGITVPIEAASPRA